MTSCQVEFYMAALFHSLPAPQPWLHSHSRATAVAKGEQPAVGRPERIFRKIIAKRIKHKHPEVIVVELGRVASWLKHPGTFR